MHVAIGRTAHLDAGSLAAANGQAAYGPHGIGVDGTQSGSSSTQLTS